jgi:hypothetical protein
MSVEARLNRLEQGRHSPNAGPEEIDLERLSEADRATVEAASEAIMTTALADLTPEQRQAILDADRILDRDPLR